MIAERMPKAGKRRVLFDPGQTGANVKAYVAPPRRGRTTPGINSCFAAAPCGASSTPEGDKASPQLQLAAALDELRAQHSGANFRRYVVAFCALEDECSATLNRFHERNLS